MRLIRPATTAPILLILFLASLQAQNVLSGGSADGLSLSNRIASAGAPGDIAKQGGAGYLLGPGDLIVIRASNVAELADKPVRIDLNGYVSLPMAGRVQAAGLTVEAMQAELTTRLKTYLEEPDVSVSVSEYQSQPVSVFGEVVVPGVHQLQGRKTLIEILSLSGGIKTDAGPTVRITRQLEFGSVPLPGAANDATGRFSVAQLEIKPLVQAKTPESDIQIMPYDVISVPKAELVFIGGDVTKSGALPLIDRPTMSIMEALSTTGGVLRTADTKKARISRLVAGSPIRAEIPVDVSKIMKGKADDVQLLAGDILFIPGSASRKVVQRALEVAIQAGTIAISSGLVNGTI